MLPTHLKELFISLIHKDERNEKEIQLLVELDVLNILLEKIDALELNTPARRLIESDMRLLRRQETSAWGADPIRCYVCGK